MVIVAYRPKLGREAELEALIREHVPILRELGLATDRPALAMRNQAGVIVEVFEWREGGIQAAHNNPAAHAMWSRYAQVCDYIPLAELPETSQMFAEFEPIDL